MEIEMYNNVPTSKDLSIIVNQYTVSAIEPATHRLIRFGYLKGGYTHQTMSIYLRDILEALGYYSPEKQIVQFDKNLVIPRLTCRIKTHSSGVREVRCLPVDALEYFLQYIIAKSKNSDIRNIAHNMVKKLPEFLNIIYKQHEILEQTLSYSIQEKVKISRYEKQAKEAGIALLATLPIFRVTDVEVKQRKRRLKGNLTKT